MDELKVNENVEVISFEDDVQAISGIVSSNIKKYDGITKAKYENTTEGLENFKKATEAYFDGIKLANEGRNLNGKEAGKPVMCDIEGWVTSIGITRMTLSNYYRTRGQEWKDYIDFVKDNILHSKKLYALNGRANPIVSIFDLTNNFGYYSTNEFHRPVESRGDRKMLSFDELMRLEDENE